MLPYGYHVMLSSPNVNNNKKTSEEATPESVKFPAHLKNVKLAQTLNIYVRERQGG